ncbi:MAG: hypothetical protein ABS901_06795 [Candidatus Limivicinus sp.]|jgi:hypothetical protein
MKRVLSVLLAAVLLLSFQAFAFADIGTAVMTTDEVTLTDTGVLVLTEDGLLIAYERPTDNVVVLTQDLDQQTLLYLLLFSSNLRAKAAEFIEQGIHMDIYDFDSGTDIFIYTEETLMSMLVPNLTAMSEDDVAVIQNYLKKTEFEGANSVTAGMIGNNLWFFGDYGTAGIMLTFVNGIQIACIFRYVDDSGPVTGLTLLDSLSVSAA